MNLAAAEPHYRELRDLAASAAGDIATFLLDEVDNHNEGETKSSVTDFVTAADKASEAKIVAAIAAARPGDGFVGEEGTNTESSTGVTWIIDPIDGTTNFVFSHPGYCVSIAAAVNGMVVAGAVADPVHNQLFDAALGHGARCNAAPIYARPTTDLSRALVATGFSYDVERRRRQAGALTVILPQIADIRRMGSAALDLCGVAIGRVDAYYELALNQWDLAAGALIASEAGAVVVTNAADTESQSATLDPLTFAVAPGMADAFQDLLHQAGLTW